MRRRIRLRQVWTCDLTGHLARIAVAVNEGETTQDAILRWFSGPPHCKSHLIAAGYIVDDLDGRKMSRPTAKTLMRAYAVADGVGLPEVLPEDNMLAALITALPLGRRALLYYDACAALGYDPAEDHPALSSV